MPGCTVLIAASELLDALKQRVQGTGEILAFADSDSLRALDAISRRRPEVVALDRLFAASTRGSALINRIAADPHLSHAEIRVIGGPVNTPRVTPDPERLAPLPPLPAEPAAVETTGTRRAGRVAIREGVEVYIDGNPAELVDLSVGGAQVLSTSVLRPNQWVRLVLPEETGQIRVNAMIAWANFEMRRPRLTPSYRAGLDFKEADARAIEAFCVKNGSGPAKEHVRI